ncbi:hypothetical protein CKN86_09535 [Carnobacterium divergens]|uniref:hypothetical protein n=1 Tax=Carnobacterium divergens TaxID=2748 RepID=UPI000D4E21EA|nr:hypothetical protein [Carnobacterium divergens]MCO6019349.1 hypothetical protein [Carnobacterium divergens]TFI60667.1 hypothetical protein CKN62_09675 [Carnobacterium divergens]TFI87690.1 hypothetical protein CKN84_09565 [Carnobacterium divergens]TFJ02257.1 hypothetical protein CKN86_09535 [Carnobacterium divergens]TFJ03768.1 hypothetical protein CKN65_09575 [Carnobacterium divergens]
MFILAQIVNLELIQKSEPGWLTPGNIISISVAIIAALAVIYNARKTTKTMSDNNKDSIDANLTAKARIEWIQVVRILVADLILILEKLNADYEYNLTEVKELLHEAKNKIGLIQLYLGPDSDNNNAYLSINDKLLNENDNDGKNNLIYYKLDCLQSKLDEIITEIQSDDKLINYKIYNLSQFVIKGRNDKLPEDAIYLKKIFRIYFKVEWKEAKLGK